MPWKCRSHRLLAGPLCVVLAGFVASAAENQSTPGRSLRRAKPMAERQIVFESELLSVPASRTPVAPVAPVARVARVVQASYAESGPTVCTSCRSRCGGSCRGLPIWRGRPCCWWLDPAQPLGASLQAHMDVQIANGQAVQLVLYRYDFHDVGNTDPSVLNRHGLSRLERLVPLMESCPWPLIIEPVPGHPEISQARKLHVLQWLSTKMRVPINDGRVVVAYPPAAGLSGVEAIEIDASLIQQTRTKGGPMPSDTSGSEQSGTGSSSGSSQSR